jgi:copper transporter 1
MDMDMHPSQNGTSMMSMMASGLHFATGDVLLFKQLQPSSAGALAGAALVLFVLAVFERWLAATRLVLNAKWHRKCVIDLHADCDADGLHSRALALAAEHTEKLYPTDPKGPSESSTCHTDDTPSSSPSLPSAAGNQLVHALPLRPPRTIAPFIFSQDATRGALHALQTLMGYVLMLAVMYVQRPLYFRDLGLHRSGPSKRHT